MSFFSLISDVQNFIKNNIVVIFFTIITLTIISYCIHFTFLSELNEIQSNVILLQAKMQQEYGDISLKTLQTMQGVIPSPEIEQLVYKILSHGVTLTIASIIISVISMSTQLALIHAVDSQQLSVHSLLRQIIKIIPKIIFFMLLAIPYFIFLTFIISLTGSLALPIALFAFLFYICLYFIFSAVIINPIEKTNIFGYIKISLIFLKKKLNLILPIILLWLACSSLLFTRNDHFLVEIGLTIFSLLLNFITICYLYRLYSLSK